MLNGTNIWLMDNIISLGKGGVTVHTDEERKGTSESLLLIKENC